MTRKIFRSILLVAGVVLAAGMVLLASLLVIMGCLYEYFGSVEKKQLRDELELAAVAVEKNGTEYLSQLSSERYRLTWIENDGTVLYDTVTDAESLENHADRVEVKQALEYGEGESTRYSSTLLQKTMYCAERLADGSVLRISMSRATAGVLLVGMGQPILVVLIVALILSSVLAKSLSHRIVQPLNKLDLEHPLENDAYEELAPLLGRINRQHLQIDEQMDELQRQQTEFSQITSSMREGLVLLDEKEHVLSINPAAEKLFGTDESCVGQDFLTIDRSHDMSLAIERAMDEGHSEARVERGGRIWQFDVSRIGASGAAVGAVLLAFDITERETAEQTRREFTANVSHELKTPLQGIIGSAELLENGMVKQEDVPRFVGHIRKEAQRLVTLIGDIIRLSQLDEGSVGSEKTDLRLDGMAASVVSRLQDAAAQHDVTLRTDLKPCRVHGIAQIVDELIEELGAQQIPCLRVYNKSDLYFGDIRPHGEDSVNISAKTGEGVDELLARIDKLLDKGTRRVTIHLPYDKGGLLDMLYREAKVESVEYGETIDIVATCVPRVIGQVKDYIEGYREPKEDWEE